MLIQRYVPQAAASCPPGMSKGGTRSISVISGIQALAPAYVTNRRSRPPVSP